MHVKDELVCRTLKETCLGKEAKSMVGDIKALTEVWNTHDVYMSALTEWRNTLQRL
jgi:hypothetical protein